VQFLAVGDEMPHESHAHLTAQQSYGVKECGKRERALRGAQPSRKRCLLVVPADWCERTERALAEVVETGTVQPFESGKRQTECARAMQFMSPINYLARDQSDFFGQDSRSCRSPTGCRSMVLYLKRISCGSRIGISSPFYWPERHISPIT